MQEGAVDGEFLWVVGGVCGGGGGIWGGGGIGGGSGGCCRGISSICCCDVVRDSGYAAEVRRDGRGRGVPKVLEGLVVLRYLLLGLRGERDDVDEVP